MSRWQRALFDFTTWSTFKTSDFENADDALYVAYVVSDVDVDEYAATSSSFMLASSERSSMLRPSLEGNDMYTSRACVRTRIDGFCGASAHAPTL
jgi:hypothetical protein